MNLAVLENNPQLHEKMVNADELARPNVERHGAIRVGLHKKLAYSSADVYHYGDVPGELLHHFSQVGCWYIRQHFGRLMMLLGV
ncbi:hypothetical protein ACNKHR_28105 [Shigella flexneri]